MRNQSIMGVQAPRPRPTFVGALWLAFVLAVPIGLIGLALEYLWRGLAG